MLKKFKKLMILLALLSLVVVLKGCDNEENHKDDGYIEEVEEKEEVKVEIPHVEPGERILWRIEPEGTEDEEDNSRGLEIQASDEWFGGIQHEARYVFEQFTLAEITSDSEETAIRFLQEADEEEMWDSVKSIWEITVSLVLMMGMLQGPDFSIGPDGSPDPFSPELHSELGLGPEHLIEGWIEEIDENTNAFIFRLLDMEIPRLSIYMAIAYNDEVGLQFFTLEEMEGVSPITGEYMFCFVAVGSRGSFYSIDGTREAFIEAIYDAMVNHTQPAISQNRSRWL